MESNCDSIHMPLKTFYKKSQTKKLINIYCSVLLKWICSIKDPEAYDLFVSVFGLQPNYQ